MRLDIRLAPAGDATGALVLPVFPSDDGGRIDPSAATEEYSAYLSDTEHAGGPGETGSLPRPLRTPGKVLFVGAGDGTPTAWRAFGAAVTRAGARETSVTIHLPEDLGTEGLRALVEGLHLATYRFSSVPQPEAKVPRLTGVTLVGVTDDTAVRRGTVTAEVTMRARDWVNTNSAIKSPEWLAGEFAAAAAEAGISVAIREPDQLAAEGFGGIVAVGSGSDRGPRLVELSWAPKDAKTHVVLVGKGITFDTGGVSIKPAAGMLLMRKDMGGAAAVVSALLGAAALDLPIRITVLTPIAENAVSGTAFRPGDVIRHYGGKTSEVMNTDAEGRLVLADALAYAVERLAPDTLLDLATLTGAQMVSLGRRTAAMFGEDAGLLASLSEAADAAGEKVWRLPMPEDYVDDLRGDVADWLNSTEKGAGTVMAAMFLREFVGAGVRWAHVDMSAPAWSDSADKELSKGATGWGTRTVLRWLESQAR